MPSTPTSGPLGVTELLELWKSATDEGYSRPIIEGGEGFGLEAITQGLAQLARLSEAVDRTTQAMFILPWSGQTNEPAGGAAHATTTLTVTRTRLFEEWVTFAAGEVLFEEVTTDFGRDGPVEVVTGRRFVVQTSASFGPGEAGPLSVAVVAERPGYGFNNVGIGNLRRIVQPGSKFGNTGATVVPGVESHRLVVENRPDVVVPGHVGQYLTFLVGANAGQTRRVTGYLPPDLAATPPNGGTVLLAPTGIFRFSLSGGAFIVGEEVEQFPSGAKGRFVHTCGNWVAIDRTLGTFVVGQVIVGSRSAAQILVDAIDQSPDLAAETGTAQWYVPSWEDDYGIEVTNAAQPSGGRAAMLDELGFERNVRRAPGESDDLYRLRVATPADTVSPNAVQRAGNRALQPLGEQVCLREVGSSKLRGLFYDGDPSSVDPLVAFAFDLDYVAVTWVASGLFLPGELVTQTTGGIVATGRAVLSYAVPASLPAPLGVGTLVGLAGVRGTFTNGGTLVGASSGATATGVTFTGGADVRDRFKLTLDYADFRGFFLLGVPPLALGDFGIAYDAGPNNAYDASPYLTFFDGFPATTAIYYRSVWQSVRPVKAGGVGYDLYIEDVGCDV